MELNMCGLLSHRLDHHSAGLERVHPVSFPGSPVEAAAVANVITNRMPITIQTGRTTAAVPPAAALWHGTFILSNVTKDARWAAIVVTVKSAETVAVLVNASVGTTDGVTFKQSW